MMKVWETPAVDVLNVDATEHGPSATFNKDGQWTDGTNHGPTYGDLS